MEQWKDIPGYEGRYAVSSLGRVSSTKDGATILLRAGRASNGYLSVSLRGKTRFVHHLVAEAFIGPRPAGAYVLHADDDKLNSAADNLRYGTPSENMHDMTRHGRRKYHPSDIAVIREAIVAGKNDCQIARELGVCRRQVNYIRHGRQYAAA
jgi:hypothetical protein